MWCFTIKTCNNFVFSLAPHNDFLKKYKKCVKRIHTFYPRLSISTTPILNKNEKSQKIPFLFKREKNNNMSRFSMLCSSLIVIAVKRLPTRAKTIYVRTSPFSQTKFQLRNYRSFSSPTWQGKKCGKFQTGIFFDSMESFLFCLSFNEKILWIGGKF